MDLSGCLGCLGPDLDGPGPGLILPGCQETHQPQQLIAGLNQLLQSGFPDSQIFQEHPALILVQLRDLLLNLGADHKHAAVLLLGQLAHRLHMGIGSAVVRQIILRHIGRVDHRLSGEQIIAAHPQLFVLILQLQCNGRLSVLQMLFDSFLQRQLLGRCLVHPGNFCGFGNSPLQNLQIRKNQLQVDGLDISGRVNASVHMDYIGILKTAHHMNDGVHLPDICQKLVAQALTFGGALNQAGDIHKLNHRRGHLFGLVKIPQKLQTLIRHRNDSHIGINGAEGIVG